MEIGNSTSWHIWWSGPVQTNNNTPANTTTWFKPSVLSESRLICTKCSQLWTSFPIQIQFLQPRLIVQHVDWLLGTLYFPSSGHKGFSILSQLSCQSSVKYQHGCHFSRSSHGHHAVTQSQGTKMSYSPHRGHACCASSPNIQKAGHAPQAVGTLSRVKTNSPPL